jgi:two-component system, NtrC family, response regulator AtoC
MPIPLVETLALDAAGLPPDDLIFGRTAPMQEICERALRLATSQVPVLILGESGTGKEVIVRFMHLHAAWKSGPFVKAHCPGIPEKLLESELFGDEEATTAAGPEQDENTAVVGTLLLDEVSELGPGAQAKFLRALQDGQAIRIAFQHGKNLKARVISTTHRAIEPEIRRDKFRPDLFYRLSVATLRLPPLRERREDIQALTEYFLSVYSQSNGHSVPPITSYTMSLLQENPWPGNIRELENLINRYCILGSEDVITDALLGSEPEPPEAPGPEGPAFSLRRIARTAARGAERKAILQVLNANQGNRKKTARVLNISYRSLLYKIRDAGIPRKGAQEKLADEPGLKAGSSSPETSNGPATH